MAKRIIRIVLEVLSLLVLLGTIVFLMIYWKRLPDQVPAHFGAHGEINSWGEKRTLWLLPIVSVFLYLFLSSINAIVLSAMKHELPPSAGVWLSAIKLPTIALFSVMTIYAALLRPLPVWLTPLSILLPLIPITGLVVASVRWELIRRK